MLTVNLVWCLLFFLVLLCVLFWLLLLLFSGATIPAATSFSATHGISGEAARRPARMIFSLSRSASVTGEESALLSTAQPSWKTRITSRPASSARRSKTPSMASSSDTAAIVILLFGNVALDQPVFQGFRHLLRAPAERLEMDFGILRRLVGRIDTSEVLDLAAQGACVKALRIAPCAFLERRIDEHFDELALGHQVPHLAALGGEGRDEGDDDDQTGIGHQLGDFGDAADVLDAIRIGEAEIAVEA